MKTIDFWFDPVSPYAHLAFERLPEAFAGLSYSVAYRPIVFAALLKAFAHKGPAEIEPKRAWTFRQVHWLAHRHGIAIETPRSIRSIRSPFRAWPGPPLPKARRRAATCATRSSSMSGAAAPTPRMRERLAELGGRLAPRLDPASDEVKQRLRDETDAALARGLFGVPTIGVDGRLFWGFDALDMAAACVRGDAWFDEPHWQREGAPRAGVKRELVRNQGLT